MAMILNTKLVLVRYLSGSVIWRSTIQILTVLHFLMGTKRFEKLSLLWKSTLDPITKMQPCGRLSLLVLHENFRRLESSSSSRLIKSSETEVKKLGVWLANSGQLVLWLGENEGPWLVEILFGFWLDEIWLWVSKNSGSRFDSRTVQSSAARWCRPDWESEATVSLAWK